MSVWQNGTAKDYSMITLDSLIITESDTILHVYTTSNEKMVQVQDIDSVTFSVPDMESTNKRSPVDLKAEFSTIEVDKTAYKPLDMHNPLMGHKFGADPFGLVVGNRLYVYMTDDHIYRSNGTPVGDGDYSDCKNVSIISTDDLVNWTDHGSQPVAGLNGGTGPAKWANNMWAPCAAHKTIGGKDKYFLYFADNASGIGVLTSDTPYGPWSQPSGMNQLISRSTANCSTVTWLFDPAVLVDDDGKAYLYFGGGVPDGKQADPGTARCVQLGDDMISIKGTPKAINPPYLFEDAGINKVGDKYIYSYCSNWTGNSGPGVANIAYMVSDSPLGPYTYIDRCFDNPGNASWGGGGGNNHHAIVKYRGKYYILYHTRTLKAAMRADYPAITDGMEVRSTCISEIDVNESSARITNLSASAITQAGPAQLNNFNPYATVPGPTMAWSRGITTKYSIVDGKSVCTAEMKDGSWMCLSSVAFGSTGAKGIKMRAAGKGLVAITTLGPGNKGKYIVIVEVDSRGYADYTVPLWAITKNKKSQLFITAKGNVSLESWSFIEQ
jgi:arabinoxylan arabinofuranohydrolase